MTRYKYERYLGPDIVRPDLRIPRKLYERVRKASLDNHQSFNKLIIELIEREFGDVEEVQKEVVSEK